MIFVQNFPGEEVVCRNDVRHNVRDLEGNVGQKEKKQFHGWQDET
jgi:hypothetical protein